MAKQSGGNTAQRVEALVRPTVEGMGLRLWDVVFEKEGPDWYLRILIDRDGTMDTDTCAEVSHALDPILDEADPIDQSYYLEVGSPGLGRKLTRPEHYEALKGQKVRAKLIRPNADGVRELSGILTGDVYKRQALRMWYSARVAARKYTGCISRTAAAIIKTVWIFTAGATIRQTGSEGGHCI